MDFFKTIFVSLLCSPLLSFPITAVAQTGSSFFYYYSPNQPMLLNSQTFGSNAQSFSGDAFNLLPSRLNNNQQRNTQLSPLSTFPDRTSHFLPQRNHHQQSSLLDKIAFENGPPPLRSPFQYQYNYDVSPTPQTTRNTPPPSRFLTQPQASPKLFNFLNQPFPFFENSFGRFQQPQNFNSQQSQPSGNELVQSTPTPVDGNARRQNFHSYYETPSQVDFDTPKSTPLSFSVNQYFTTKTTNGPASYTFTIEANPTSAGPTAKVHVNLGSESLPSTFPTLPSLSFTLPNRDNKESEIETEDKSEDIATTTPIPVSSTSTTVAPEEILVSTMSSSTLSSSTEAATEPSSTTTTTTTSSLTTTTEISLDQQDGNSVARKPVKRVIIVRRKLAGKRRLSVGENINDVETKESEIDKSVPDFTVDKSTTENPPILSTTESVLRSTTTTEATSATTSINPIITTTEKGETLSTTTESIQPTTFRPTLNEISSSTSTEPILIEPTTNAPVKNISLTTTEDEYEYYYYDDEENTESSSKSSSHLENFSTEAPSSTTKISTSTLAVESEDIFQATTMPPLILEDEVIEPLSTTEPILSTTQNILIPSTTTTENIPVTTYRPSISTSTEEDQEVATTTTLASNETEQATEKNEVDESVTEKALDSENETSDNERNSNYDFQDEYTYSQEDYIVSDPLEDERILEAQRAALQTALKNIRSRLQNASTTEKPEDDDQPKKYIRRPIKVKIPLRTSNAFESSINVDDDELGDSRMHIIQKIQIFRTKLRKVSNGSKFKTTTKRPRRVTRPSDEPSSSTSSSSTSTEEPVTTTASGNISELAMKVGSSTEIILASTTETPSTTSILLEIEPQLTATEESQPTTKLVGSLNITEVLPSSTQSTSTTAFLTELDKHEKFLKKDTEDLILTGTSTSNSMEDALVATTVEPKMLNISTEESVIETSTSRTIRERKVKVILKRRKGAPSGTGTVARQVIRTRTRVKGREEKSSPSL